MNLINHHLKLYFPCFLIIICFSCESYSQEWKPPFRQIIETDSSRIEIIRNSVYKVYEEFYHDKDSVWRSVHFIDDTTRLSSQGWSNKNEQSIGFWVEYDYDGNLLYTRNYDDNTCNINEAMYPYFDVVKKMKQKADSLIIATYSQAFFDNHVRFEYDCVFYGSSGNYLGTWIESLRGEPKQFDFEYSVKISSLDWQIRMFEIRLDSNGNYIPNAYDGFEKVDGNHSTFSLDKDKAIEIAQSHGLILTDSSKINEFLSWENSKKEEFYNGRFVYYITHLTDTIHYTKNEHRQGIIYKYDVYIFNPWNSKFIGMKKMKRRREWGKNSGHTTGLMPDD